MATSSRPYTYQLPYSVRRDICNILDADESWRTLGGHFMALDATQLTLIGQAYLRNASPTEELFRKLDSANMRISELCGYLQQMNHERALCTLRGYLLELSSHEQQQQQQQQAKGALEAGLSTPTPSFSGIQPAELMMNSAEFAYLMNNENYNAHPCDWPNTGARAPLAIDQVGASAGKLGAAANARASRQPELQAGGRCHRTGELARAGREQLADGQACALESQAAAANADEQRLSQLWLKRARQRRGVNVREVQEQLKLIMQISYEELKQASANFSHANILGNGGFSYVYRGLWKGTHVAIKRLCSDHMDQALNELIILNKHKIDNILPLYGISIDGPEACLVTQFMSNGSLEDRLACKAGSAPLSWQQRATIGEGVAKALYYLHTVQPDKPLVHGDVKPANVLLDGQFQPKLADFGMARQMFAGNQREHTNLSTHCTVSAVQGTFHYLPHEFLRNKKLSEAVDVYSYGIVMLEMATGKRAVLKDKGLLINLVEDEKRRMQSSASPASSGAPICYTLKDARLSDEHQHDQHSANVGLRIWFELLLRLGVNCSQEQRKRRPNMGQVLNHFAQFKQSLTGAASQEVPLSGLLDYNLLDKTISLEHSSSTVPELATTLAGVTPEPQLAEAPLASQAMMARQSSGFQPNNSPAKPAQPSQLGHSSAALMSGVEEEQQQQEAVWKQQAQYQAHKFKAGQEQHAVEDMIPLLTELGFESPQQAVELDK